MKNALIGGLLGAAIALLVGYVAWQRPMVERMNSFATPAPPTPVKPRYASITLTRNTDPQHEGECKAAIDNEHMGGFEDEMVQWSVVDDELPSCAEGAWAVWLEFIDQPCPTPRCKFRIGRSGRAVPINHGENAVHGKNHKYIIWMIGDHGSDYKLMDPDLEIEPPVKEVK